MARILKQGPGRELVARALLIQVLSVEPARFWFP